MPTKMSQAIASFINFNHFSLVDAAHSIATINPPVKIAKKATITTAAMTTLINHHINTGKAFPRVVCPPTVAAVSFLIHLQIKGISVFNTMSFSPHGHDAHHATLQFPASPLLSPL